MGHLGKTWIGLAAGAALAIAATSAAAAPAESRYTKAGETDCSQSESGEDQGQDWLLYRCTAMAGIPVWMLFQDSTRMQLAFGPNNFDHYAPFSTDRDDSWALEWRGVGKGTAFKPYAVIARMRPIGETRSVLAVYWVWGDKPSCLVGQAATNAEARRIADAPDAPACS